MRLETNAYNLTASTTYRQANYMNKRVQVVLFRSSILLTSINSKYVESYFVFLCHKQVIATLTSLINGHVRLLIFRKNSRSIPVQFQGQNRGQFSEQLRGQFYGQFCGQFREQFFG